MRIDSSYSQSIPTTPQSDGTLRLQPQHNQAKAQAEADIKQSLREQLPAHTQKMLEQIERVKEQIDQARERLRTLQNEQDPNDEEAHKTMLESQRNLVANMEVQLMQMTQAVTEALKEAGISDPGILLSALS
ncbi:hypothetical protein [Pseudoalteromonas ruthenica]|uniref:hypothetical protein n=1 Tax=Pseudoalteromonas ruthenica TaxID=151081 RepID=UPI000699149B|nr:hypothetical protein [Pseudoalteromonas ruthenica]TMO90177.1 hypothetical protein CWC12_01565 [Pseudoalteromonas ruthenica]TMO90833.1 hypothetical protein CWC13_18380 [Pseudoalteromonas ruthenica]TMP01070.1 hypothetical protein CWC07_01750 [Pseudoalteromonas ruthenica]TMP09700.1 hypothetical protein CWC08_09740 [Pseudoalteromonas ruthenica]TMP11570.1 hypothetical protein CWC09_03085 [Pseudoalteromonas ruthenica]